MENINAEIEAIEAKLARLKKQRTDQEAARLAAALEAADDTELLKQCAALLEYVSYHDGRYGQANNYNRFVVPAQELVTVLAKRLGRPAYSGFSSSV